MPVIEDYYIASDLTVSARYFRGILVCLLLFRLLNIRYYTTVLMHFFVIFLQETFTDIITSTKLTPVKIVTAMNYSHNV